ncbi:MAG: hypothetical protein ACI8QC_003212 [Planctomycetota bacterium]|jgi:hypothetical protein
MSMATKLARGALLTIATLCLAPIGAGQEHEQAPAAKAQPSAIAQVASAVAKAQHDNRRAFILWSEHTVGDDPLKAVLRANRKLSKLMQYEYVRTWVGAKDEGVRALASRLGVDMMAGLPAVTLLDGKGQKLTHLLLADWQDAGKFNPERIEATLLKYKPKPQDAEVLYKSVQEQAKQSGKRLLVHLGAPW